MFDFRLINKDSITDLKKIALEKLNSAEVIFLPTDTVFGIISTDPEKICWIKNKPPKTPLQVLSSFEVLDRLVSDNVLNNKIFQVFRKSFWPGGLSCIVETKQLGRQCIRIPKHPFLSSVLQEFDKPVFASSLNLHGEKELSDSNEIKAIAQPLELDILILYEKPTENTPMVSSTIIDLKCTSKNTATIQIIRENFISKSVLFYALERNFEITVTTGTNTFNISQKYSFLDI